MSVFYSWQWSRMVLWVGSCSQIDFAYQYQTESTDTNGCTWLPEHQSRISHLETIYFEHEGSWLFWHRWYWKCKTLLSGNNISPKVSYSNGQIVALHVPLYKQHIYKTPMYANSLLRWSDELSRIGYHVPYLGEGLASFTHNVILALVKNKRKKVSRAERFSILETTTSVVHNVETKGMHSAISSN